MPSQSHDCLILKPKSRSEALNWAYTVENYSFKMAFNQDELKIPYASIARARVFRLRRGDKYVINYRLEYANQLLSSTAPDPSPLNFEEAGTWLFTWQFIKENIRANTQAFSIVFVLLLTAAQIILILCADSFLSKQIDQHQWFIRGSCGAECAQKLLSATSSFAIPFAFIFAFLISPIFAYMWKRKSAKTYANFMTFRVMTVASIVMSVFLILGSLPLLLKISPKLISAYQKYQSGTLTLRTPATETLKTGQSTAE